MIDRIEFDDFRKVRKSLLIFSIIGVLLKFLINNAKGDFNFLGFTIPLEKTSFLPILLSLIIFYYLCAIVVRYYNEKFLSDYEKEYRNKNVEKITKFSEIQGKTDELQRYVFDKVMNDRSKNLRRSVFILDLVFPILLGITSVILLNLL